jgi:hypothetical protein
MEKRQFSAYYGHRRGRGGWLIKEEMIILAHSLEDAITLAQHRVMPNEQLLRVEAFSEPDGLCQINL